MALARYPLPLPLPCRAELPLLHPAHNASLPPSPPPALLMAASDSNPSCASPCPVPKARAFSSNRARARRLLCRAQAESNQPGVQAVNGFTHFKHVLLPIIDQNPYLSEGTREAAATTTALAKKYGADITVVVIDKKPKDSIPEHDARLSSIRWHLSEGGFEEFKLMERLGEGKKPTAIIGEVADEMNLDMVVLPMAAIHSNHVDGNLLAEFIPCPVLLLPL